MATPSQIMLTSSEGTEFLIDRDIADKSMLLKCMLEDIGEIGQAVPLPNVSGPILSKVIEYCTHHRNDPDFQSANDDAAADIGEWDLEYCKVDQGTLYELILAANYLDIKPLLDLTCKTVANMIKAKSPEEIRKTFNITNDFTPEEEDQVRRENVSADIRDRLRSIALLSQLSLFYIISMNGKNTPHECVFDRKEYTC